jgi:two-component system response regulator WspF
VDGNSSKVFDALGAGALDAVNTPSIGTCGGVEGSRELLRKIKILGKLTNSFQPKKVDVGKMIGKAERPLELPFLVAIGSSTGGPNALAQFFKEIPEDINAAFVVAQHVDKQFAPGLVAWLDHSCKLKVKLAEEGDFPHPGTVYVAATNDHLIITKDMTMSYTSIPEDNPFRPSVDVFFDSVACNWKKVGAGALLTGIGRDGADGLLNLKKAGWRTYAQDKESCVVYGMPKAAVEVDAACDICPPEEIGRSIVKLTMGAFRRL